MEISFSNVNRSMPPHVAAGGAVPSAAKPVEGWKFRETGAAELAKVAGEETVDEAALRRDDDLGKLMSKAFDLATATAALPPLGLGDVV